MSLYAPLEAYVTNYDLNPPGTPEQRRFLSYRAQSRMGFSPDYVTKGMAHLVRAGVVAPPTLFRAGTQFQTKVFHVGDADPVKMSLCKQRAVRRAELMDPRIMGETFQEVVRKTLWAARARGCDRYSRIQQSGKLGFTSSPGSSYRIDLPVRYKAHGVEYPLAFETKNENDPAHITDGDKFPKLIRMALEAGAQPALVAAFVAPNTYRLCSKIGIAVYDFRRQFLPRAWEKEILAAQLFPNDILEDAFEFVTASRFLRTDRKVSARSQRDIDTFASDWIDVAHVQWERLRRKKLLYDVADLIDDRDVHELNDLLRAYA